VTYIARKYENSYCIIFPLPLLPENIQKMREFFKDAEAAMPRKSGSGNAEIRRIRGASPLRFPL
jgi:hypothetical protein